MAHYLTFSYESLEKKASNLKVASKKISDSLKSGNFFSNYKGQGLEFSGLREYFIGDDVRNIDWNVTARFRKPYIKTYETENEMQFFLLIDTSPSMFINDYNEKNYVRYKKSAEISAILAVTAENINCPIGMALFDGEIYFSALPKKNKNQTMMLLSKLDDPYKNEKKTNGTSLREAIIGAEKILKRRSIVFIISDFRTDGWKNDFLHLAQKHDVKAIMVLSESDTTFPSLGNIHIKDPETDEILMLSTNDKDFKNVWKQENKNRIQNLSDFFHRNGSVFSIINTNEDSIFPLLKMLKEK